MQQPPQPVGGSYHHESTTYMKGSPAGTYYQQQPTNPSYEEFYQQGSPTRGSYYHSAPHMAGYSSYVQEGVPISDF